MKLPESNFTVKVGPFVYEVIYSSEIADESSVFGSTHNNDQKIFLDPQRKKQKQEQTFIHEILHACMFVNGLCYRLGDKEDTVSEEDIIRETSVTLYQVLKDNPEVFGP